MKESTTITTTTTTTNDETFDRFGELHDPNAKTRSVMDSLRARKAAKLQKIHQRDRSLLFLVCVDGEIVGMISRPRDTRSTQSAWAASQGIGMNARVVGSSFDKDKAVALVVA